MSLDHIIRLRFESIEAHGFSTESHKVRIINEKSVFDAIMALISEKIVEVIDHELSISSGDLKEKLSTYFYTSSPISFISNDKNYAVFTFHYERKWYMMLFADTNEDLDILLRSFLPPDLRKTIDGSHPGYFHVKINGARQYVQTFVANGPRFDDLVGLEATRDTLISDIENYFSHLEEFRAMGMNVGLSYVFKGPPGVGKTSTVKALARHLRCNLLISDLSEVYLGGDYATRQLNPKLPGRTIVLVDDYNGENLKKVSQAIFDNGEENIIRIFVTNNFEKLKSSAFISRCRRVFSFERPNTDTLKTYIGKIFKVDPEMTSPLVSEINRFEVERKARLEFLKKEAELKYEEDRIAAQAEKKLPPSRILIVDSDPPGFRELNYFLCEFIGVTNPIERAVEKFHGWATDRASITPGTASSSGDIKIDGCTQM